MNKNSAALLATALILVAGCSGLQKAPPIKQRFVGLDVNLSAPTINTSGKGSEMTCTGETILIKELFDLTDIRLTCLYLSDGEKPLST